jgi:hypothetical protein
MRCFSINRPMVSTKLLRLPTRGALGNGLRVVTGAVLASGGSLVGSAVTPRGQGNAHRWRAKCKTKDEDLQRASSACVRDTHQVPEAADCDQITGDSENFLKSREFHIL